MNNEPENCVFHKYIKSINVSLGIYLGAIFLIGQTLTADAFTIDFNYDYDTNNFFFDDPGVSGDDGELRRNSLEEAANYYETYISDDFAAITNNPSSTTGIGYDWGGVLNTWTASFSHPVTGNTENITDFTVAANTITIFAGGKSFSDDTLGQGGTGGFSVTKVLNGSGDVLNQDFIDLVTARGEIGALESSPTDIGLWGGSITFDNDSDVNGTAYIWNNDLNSTPASGEVDFLSVAIHELGHVLGFGGNSWNTNVSSGEFIGTQTVTSYGSNVPLSGSSHWAEGLTSIAIDRTPNQEVALDPSLTIGSRKLLTELDYSGLKDIGWEVSEEALDIQPVPFEFSPGLGILLTCGFFGILKTRHAWQNRKK